MSDDDQLYATAKKIYPQSVTGLYRRIKWGILLIGLGIYYFLPFLRWNRGENLPDQAVLFDFAHRRFYFFWIEIWPHEVYYFTGLLILAAMVLFLMNAVAGRIWCGYLCPQTVWTDLYMAVERFFEGDRRDRMIFDKRRWDLDKILRKSAKHAVWLLIAACTGGAWVLYFADAPQLIREIFTGTAPFQAYTWIGILTFTTYSLAGIMREQVCIYMCPWPRIQAALTDDEALNVTYRYDRGEPRASLKTAVKTRQVGEKAGDCIDCDQCVAVCPTGIDIRHGSQLECIQCGLCMDACDNVMRKINRPTGLIAYDTDDNVRARLEGRPTRPFHPFRPRTMIYVAFILAVSGGMLYQLSHRAMSGINLLHDRAPLFVMLSNGAIRNGYTIRLINKRPDSRNFVLSTEGVKGAELEIVNVSARIDGLPAAIVEPNTTREIRVLITAPKDSLEQEVNDIKIKAIDVDNQEVVVGQDHFFAPK